MTEKSLARQPVNFSQRSQLRAIFNQYLQEGMADEHLIWESITTKDGLPHHWIYDLFEDSRNRVWVGTWGGGLACYDQGVWQSFTTKDGLHCNEVTCIREDKTGRIWLATDNGLNLIKDNHITDAGLKGKSLLNLTFDQQGNLWVGCWRAARSGGGLYRFNGHEWTSFSTKDQLPGLEILKVFNDSQNRIWVGTYEQGVGAGVGCFDGKHWSAFSSKQGLINDCVYSMFEDPSGNMWFGTIGGISIFDNQAWTNLTKKDGLIDDRIYCMYIDTHKKMWFGTEEGVNRFDGKNWISYTKKDGLIENLVRSIIECHDGSIWFGTYPYGKGKGGISVARYQTQKSLPDRVLDLLPEPIKPKELPDGKGR